MNILDFFLNTEGYKVSQSEFLSDLELDTVTFELFFRKVPEHGVVVLGLEEVVKEINELEVTRESIDILDKLFLNSSYINPNGNRILSWPKQLLEDSIEKYSGKIPLSIKGVLDGTIVFKNQVVATITVPGQYAIFALLTEQLLTTIWVASQFSTKTAILKNELFKYFTLSVDENRLSNIIHKVHLTSLKLFQSSQISLACGISHLLFFDSTDNIHAMYAFRSENLETGHTGNGISYATLQLIQYDTKMSNVSYAAHFEGQHSYVKNNKNTGNKFRIKYDEDDIEFIFKEFIGDINSKGYKKLQSLIFIENACSNERFIKILSLLEQYKISGDSIILGLNPDNFLSLSNEYDLTYKLKRDAINHDLLTTFNSKSSLADIRNRCKHYGQI